ENELILDQVAVSFKNYRIQKENELMQSLLEKNSDELNKAEKHHTLNVSLSARFHKELLIDKTPSNIAGLSIALGSVSSEEVDSDFISFFTPVTNIIDVVIGDVMGKGIASTLVATALKSEITLLADLQHLKVHMYNKQDFWKEDLFSIREILQKVHAKYYQKLVELEFYVSLLYARIDLEKRSFSFVDCGFTKPLYFRNSTKKASYIAAANFPLGILKDQEYFVFQVEYEIGDFFLLYSDGLSESKSPSGELYGEDRLVKLIEINHKLPAEELAITIKSAIATFTEKELPDDDLTFLILSVDSFLSLPSPSAKSSKFNSNLAQLDADREWIREVCGHASGNSELLSIELELAMGEIFTNIVLHSYKGEKGHPVFLKVELSDTHLYLEVFDRGHSFHPAELPSLNLYGDNDHGYGWYLIKKIMDEIVYVPKLTSRGWNRLCLKKRYLKQGNLMDLAEFEKEGALVIRLDFESLDAKRVPEFKEKVLQMVGQKNKNRIIFDLQSLKFIDSSGLGAFLSLMRQLNARGIHVAFSSLSKPVKTIFELVSMQKIFDCYETLDQAVVGNAKR
ncbi:MAG: anti-sigma factor antagonist, partial [Parachlamydiaceae bacterium]